MGRAKGEGPLLGPDDAGLTRLYEQSELGRVSPYGIQK